MSDSQPKPGYFQRMGDMLESAQNMDELRTGLQQDFEFVGRQRPGEQEALTKVATGLGQQLALLLGLYAFRRHFHAERMRHDDNGLA